MPCTSLNGIPVEILEKVSFVNRVLDEYVNHCSHRHGGSLFRRIYKVR